MIPHPSEEEEQQHLSDFYTPAGRDVLYQKWLANLTRREPETLHMQNERSGRRTLFERWMRDLIKRGYLNPLRPLPAQSFLAEPFHIHTDQVARVLRRLRKERLLPPKELRMNAGEPAWTERDLLALEWIADMRAVRYDQMRRLFSRESEFQTKDPELLSMSRTTELIKRYVKTGNAVYQPIMAKQPGWVWLTRKGLKTFSDEGYGYAGAPAPGTINHLYWINEVRLHLEELNSDECDVWWTSERYLQHQREQMKTKGEEDDHRVDGTAEIVEKGKSREFEIEVELSRKNDAYLQKLMRGGYDGFSMEPLCYYVGEAAKTTVLTAMKKVVGTHSFRPWVEVYSLPDFKLLGRLSRKE